MSLLGPSAVPQGWRFQYLPRLQFLRIRTDTEDDDGEPWAITAQLAGLPAGLQTLEVHIGCFPCWWTGMCLVSAVCGT